MQASRSSKDRIDEDRMVTITEPVNAKGGSASPSSYIVSPGPLSPAADSPPETPKHQIGTGISVCPESHPISRELLEALHHVSIAVKIGQLCSILELSAVLIL